MNQKQFEELELRDDFIFGKVIQNKEGMYQYTFRQLFEEDVSLGSEDGRTRIFFNTKGSLRDVPEELRELIKYIETKQPESTFTKKLDYEVECTKRNEKWRREYMKQLLYYFDVKEEGRKEGERFGKTHAKQIAFRESIYVFLRDLIAIPEELKQQLENIQDTDLLQNWIKLAAKSKDIKGFTQNMNQV